MKNKKLIKTIKLILIPILIIYAISLSIIYNIFGYGHYLLDSENRKIYSTVCKNMDFKSQKLTYFETSPNGILVQLKQQYFGSSFLLYGIFYFFDFNPFSDIDGMLKMHEELSLHNKSVTILVGAQGSSDYKYKLYDDTFVINEYSVYAIKAAVSRNDIKKLDIDVTNLTLEKVEDELPANYSIKDLICHIDSNGTPNINSFKGLESLDLCIHNSEEGNSYFNMNFLNEMPHLETIVIRWRSNQFDFSDISEHTGVKKFVLYTDDCTEEDEKLFHDVFPNAEIEIICND